MWNFINEHQEVIITILLGVVIRFFEKRDMKKKSSLMGEKTQPK